MATWFGNILLQLTTHNKKDRTVSFDLMRVCAIGGVIGIHILNPIYARPDFFGGTIWWLSLSLDALFRTSVPLFIMLSGALLLNKETTLDETVQRITKRLLIPLFFFYFILQALSWWRAQTSEASFALGDVVSNLAIATGSPLYFLVGLALLYVCIPILQPFIQTASQKELTFYTTFFLINGALATLSNYLVFHSTAAFGTFTLGFQWLGYFLAGHVLVQYYNKLTTRQLYSTAAIFLGSLLVSILLSFTQWQLHHQGDDTWFMGYLVYSQEFLSVSVIPLSLSAGALLLEVQNRHVSSQIFRRVLAFLASISFGLYLTHILVLEFIQKVLHIVIDNPSVGLAGYLIQASVYTLILSTALTILIQRTPVLKRVLGE